MTGLPERAQQALDAFTSASGWEARARLLLQWGQALAPLSDAERQPQHQVHGCDSQVWVVAQQHGGRWHFRADSDARLVRGLLAVLLARVDGLSGEALNQVDLADWFARLGLSRQLSPSRSNGLSAVLHRMHELAAADAAGR